MPEELSNIIYKIYEEQKKTNTKLDSLQNKVDGLQDQVNGLQNQVNRLQEQVDSLQDQVNRLQDQVNRLQEQVDGLQVEVVDLREQVIEIRMKEIPAIHKELRKLSDRIAVIEKEHGEKLQILFDAFVGNNEKNNELKKRIEKHEKIIEKHSSEIYLLKEKARRA